MTIRVLLGDVLVRLRELPENTFDCVVTSPPYWGLRDYGVEGQIGLEPTLGEHIDVMVRVFAEVHRVLKPSGTLWLNYGDCYATSVNGRSAADTKALGTDDRTFRDKPFSTVGAIYQPDDPRAKGRAVGKNAYAAEGVMPTGRVVAGGTLKPKDLCMIPNRLAIALQEWGWWVRAENVWGKTNPMPDSSGRYRPSTAHEKVFLLTKTGKSYYDWAAVSRPASPNTHSRLAQDVEHQVGSARANGGTKTNGNMKAVRGRSTYGRQTLGDAVPEADRRKLAEPGSGIRNNSSMDEALAIMPETRFLRNYEPAAPIVWEMATQSFRDAHFATFPPELVERCLLAGCPKGGTVLDPFGGAGTTALVADQMQLDATIIELNPEYVHIAVKRIEADRGAIQNALDPIDLFDGRAVA